MSPPKMDRNLRSDTGKNLPAAAEKSFAEQIADALDAGFGGAPSRVKRVARLTRTNERTVKNWFLGLNSPNGHSLVALMQHSPDVRHRVLRLAGREGLVMASNVSAARSQLRAALATLDDLLDPSKS